MTAFGLTFRVALLFLLGVFFAGATSLAQSQADCNGDGVADAAAVKAGNAADCDANGIPDECDVAPLRFDLVGGPVLGTEPRSMDSADFNGDGLIDLCTGNLSSDRVASVSVLRNQGDGSFDRHDLNLGVPLSDPVSGDFNGDGHLDIVARSGQTLRLFENDGEGGFPSSSERPLEHTVRGVGVYDLDGDGSDDIAIVMSSIKNDEVVSQLAVFWGGDQGLSKTPTVITVGDSPISLAVGDFNGDNRGDVAIGNETSSQIVLVWNRGERAFEVGSPALYWLKPTFISAGDFNGDTVLDLLVVGERQTGVFVGDGEGDFTAADSFVLTQTTRTAAVGDFDDDGDLDVAIATGLSPFTLIDTPLTVLLNDGKATFVAAQSFRLPTVPQSLDAADFDSDGKVDLAASNLDSVEILVKSSEEPPISLGTSNFPAVGTDGGAAFFDGDSLVDVLVAESRRITLYTNAGDGTFRRGQRVSTSRWTAVAVGDLDGDVDPDVVAINGTRLGRWYNDGNGGFMEARAVTLGASFVTIINLDGDSSGEIVTVNSRTNQLGVTFKGQPRAQTYVVPGEPNAAAGGDFDGDGHVDVVVTSEMESKLTILRNTGDGTLARIPSLTVESCSYVAADDIDSDGDVDIVALSRATRTLSVLFNSGGGKFGLTRSVALGRPLTDVQIVDINDDGQLDIVGSGSHGMVTFLFGRGDGALSEPYHVSAVQSKGDDFSLVVADVDAGPNLDFVAIGTKNSTILSNAIQGPDFRERICTEAAFDSISIVSPGEGNIRRIAKFMVPARPDDKSLLPPLFQNVHRYELHQDFLAAVFADRFPAGLTLDAYNRLVNFRASRDYFPGVLGLMETDEGPIYGFSLLIGFEDPSELPTLEETRTIYQMLKGMFLLEPLVYVPVTEDGRASALSWKDPGFPINLDDPSDDVEFEAYTRGIGYGRVRLLDAESFHEANDRGEFSFQDVLVLERAPRDIEGVFGGVFTAELQGALSHLAIRTARRKTPNAFVRNALEAFTPFDGKLVRVEVSDGDYRVVEVAEEEATAWWDQNRPDLSVAPSVDPDFGGLPALLEIDLSEGASPGELPPESRFGGKATNFARLQQLVLTGEWSRYREKGFSIPSRYYLEFMRANRIASAIEPEREVTYEEYVKELAESGEMQTNSLARFEALDDLRDHIRDNSQVDEALVARLAARVEQVFGGTDFRVRFRSSSNVEDALEFNGAGLYNSTSVCTADFLDDDEVGPSICDATRENERGIARGLRTVWRSLWNFRAYEERAFYGIEQTATSMSLLVNRAFVDEKANGVAFTGNPANPLDSRYLISVQAGEESVVSPEPGILPETDILDVVDGTVVSIVRASRSTLVPEGKFVLSDAELEELGALLWHIDKNFSLELGDHHRREVLLDLEFKIEANGRLAVKQVRPFLLTEPPPPPPPTFRLEIPPDRVACDPFVLAQPPSVAYRARSTVRFRPGIVEIPTENESFPGELFEEVRFGGKPELASPDGPGVFRVRRIRRGGTTDYTISFEQRFVQEDGASIDLTLTGLSFHVDDNNPQLEYTFFDSLFEKLRLTGRLRRSAIRYESCSFASSPHTEETVTVPDGSTIRFAERFGVIDTFAWIKPLRIIWVNLNLRGVPVIIKEPFNLVHRSIRHQHIIHRWFILDPPVEVPGLQRPVHVVEFEWRHPRAGSAGAEVSYFDQRLRLLRRISVGRQRVQRDVRFQRGDSNSDGAINVSDAIDLLGFLYRDSTPPPCMKAADVNDSGTVTITDAVTLLFHLFPNREPPRQPFDYCGIDPTNDDLSCEAHPACEDR